MASYKRSWSSYSVALPWQRTGQAIEPKTLDAYVTQVAVSVVRGPLAAVNDIGRSKVSRIQLLAAYGDCSRRIDRQLCYPKENKDSSCAL